MANKRKRTVAPGTSSNPTESYPEETKNGQTREASGYEKCREQRIRENLERMRKLGIRDLSLKVKSLNTLKLTPRSSTDRKPPQSSSPFLRQGPVRRSPRLQSASPAIYSEPQLRLSKKDRGHKASEKEDILRVEGAKPEFYTEVHEKLLGITEKSWELFKDSYGADGMRFYDHGRRIYDPVRGKTCHQCRQKTLGHRTHCSRCQKVQGQFCTDCLFTRYGEHILEAKQNPNWICPPCRGICNCSLCRKARGWSPTGYIYKKISSLGYKSVAHYLAETHRASSESQKNAIIPHSAKRSLTFTKLRVPSDMKGNLKSIGGARLEHGEKTASELEDKMEVKVLFDKQGSPRATDDQHGQCLKSKNKDNVIVSLLKGPLVVMGDHHGLGLQSKDKKDEIFEEEKTIQLSKNAASYNELEDSLILMGTSVGDRSITVHIDDIEDKTSSKPGRKIAGRTRARCKIGQSGIAGRTRSRCKLGDIKVT